MKIIFRMMLAAMLLIGVRAHGQQRSWSLAQLIAIAQQYGGGSGAYNAVAATNNIQVWDNGTINFSAGGLTNAFSWVADSSGLYLHDNVNGNNWTWNTDGIFLTPQVQADGATITYLINNQVTSTDGGVMFGHNPGNGDTSVGGSSTGAFFFFGTNFTFSPISGDGQMNGNAGGLTNLYVGMTNVTASYVASIADRNIGESLSTGLVTLPTSALWMKGNRTLEFTVANTGAGNITNCTVDHAVIGNTGSATNITLATGTSKTYWCLMSNGVARIMTK